VHRGCIGARGGCRGALLTHEVMVGVGAKREPNRLLAAVMQEAGISNKGLAARVRAEAEQTGHDASPDHVSVRRWLDGVRPHDETARCIATVLSAKLGRKLSFTDLGFDAPETATEDDVVDDGAHYSANPEQAVDVLADLTSADLADSPLIKAAGWSPDVAPSIITGYMFADPLRFDQGGPVAESGAEVASRIRATVRYLMDLDFQFGGGHTRKMLLFYWKTEIVPALRQSYPDLVRREVFAAAADAAEVLGWAAYDAGRHGAAQRYFVQGLRLAREANDQLMGGQILSNLSHQANYLGNFSDAVQFARAAQAATGTNATATVSAMFLAMEARALASIGDARGCAEILHRAEQTFERSNPGEDPEWISYFDALELAGEAAHCFRDLGQPEETQRFAEQAIDLLHTPPRTRAFIGMVSAAGALSAGNVDEAVSVATAAIGQAGSLQSSRYLRYVSDFHRSITEHHASHAAVREFAELVSTSYPTLIVPGSVRTAASQGTARRAASASGPDTRPRSPVTRQRSA
jgi:tetratricopeptide (TPR) repeat protein